MASTAVLQCLWSCHLFPSSNCPFRPNALCFRKADLVYVNIYKRVFLKNKTHQTEKQKKKLLHTVLPNRNTKRNKCHVRNVGYCQGRAHQYHQDDEQWQQIKLARSTNPFEAFASCISYHSHTYCNTPMLESRFKYIKLVWCMKTIKVDIAQMRSEHIQTAYIYLWLQHCTGQSWGKKAVDFFPLRD